MNFGNHMQLEDMLTALSGMSKTDLETLADSVFDILHTNKDSSVYSLCENRDHSVCKKCGSIHIVKRGKNPKGHQKYWCKDCGSIFTVVSDTVFSFTHKEADTWRNFILQTLEGRSLRYCAEHCDISLSTSFTWRHKIMNAMKAQQFADSFSGLIELDELSVNVSYKGNHKHSKTFVMPRKSYKRGSDNRSRFPKDKACVLTVVNRGNGFSGIVTHRGHMTPDILSSCFDSKITDET
ncbi:MAG: IS1 family transposase, partial [Clostridia bacterium]|nr:IS1 family transposase [Clostridia bacterium]